MDVIDIVIVEIDSEVKECIEFFRITVELLITIKGMSELGARVIAAEIGNDMSRFAIDEYIISRVSLCLKNDESEGKRCYNSMRKGAFWLKIILI